MVFALHPGLLPAASISNLSDMPQKIEVETTNGYEPQIIEAGRVYSTIGKAHIRYGKHEALLEEFEEYAIWQDGTFGPQFRLQDKKSRNANSGFGR